jgi:hypothetical protein
VVVVLGLLIGYWMETRRVDTISKQIDELSIQNSDALLQMSYLENFKNKENFCNTTVNKTLELIHNAIQKGMDLERYEKINRLAPGFLEEKKQYATLLLRLWFNTIELKNVCEEDYSTIVYFYKQYAGSGAKKTAQDIQSRALLELESICGKNNVLIFALPYDLNITTISLITNQYNITKTPATLVNEEVIFEGVTNYNEIVPYIKCDKSD